MGFTPQLRKHWTTEETALHWFNAAFYHNNDKSNEFMVAPNNRFQALQDLLKEEETTMEDKWKGIKKALSTTRQEVLGRNKHYHKE
ncbi:unnamed protein product [Schistosoma mattheei]|uniref:Uncharacterized protein n=1 Tax=Schistosoma mattheei TaxID=31246 RepID=A0A183P7X7_9TREM|nr:unnamed protein product [Schistosoma mattheei]